jgi:cobalamin biosynthesis Mg chelatase CobN
MSVNNPNPEYRTREEYKRAKAEELQRKKDAEKRAKDEARRLKDAEKQAKDEARQAKNAENQSKAGAQQTKDAEKKSKADAQRTKDTGKQAKAEARQTKNAEKQAQTEAIRQKLEKTVTPKGNTREGQRSKDPKTCTDSNKKVSKDTETTPVGYQRIRIRLIPIWLRIILLAVLIVFSVVAGAAVGYGLIGGEEIADVFNGSTWTHIIDLVEKGN